MCGWEEIHLRHILIVFHSWRQEVDGLLRKQQTEVLSLKKQNEDQQKQIEDQQKQIENQSRLIKLIAKASGIEVEEWKWRAIKVSTIKLSN